MLTPHSYRLQASAIILSAILGIVASVSNATEKTTILDVTDISAWEHKSFNGDTQYSISNLAGKACIKATSHQSASGIFRDIKIDLHKTPVMHWDWFVTDTLGDIDETEKSGDDYAARLYVVISGGMFFWKTRAINYVWASQKPKASSWPNAFSSNAMMVAIESGENLAGHWVHESRNVLDDIKTILKTDAQFIDAVAIMTDTDNSGKQAIACYGEIYFSQR